LTAPEPGEKLIMYLSAGATAVSAVPMTDRKGVQTPIYFVSRALKDAETRYSHMEKLTLSLVHASRRLRWYFQAYVVEVQMEQPIPQILRRPGISGRLTNWAIERGPLDIEYKLRSTIKGQVIVDFLTEIPKEDANEAEVERRPETQTQDEVWDLYTDGASNDEGSGAGLILISPDKTELTYVLRLDSKAQTMKRSTKRHWLV
jgi:hypothetical protein